MSNRIRLEHPEDVDNVIKYSNGVKPKYGKKGSTQRGVVWCTCGKCVGHILMKERKVVGWFDLRCSCGNEIDWSEAIERL